MSSINTLGANIYVYNEIYIKEGGRKEGNRE